MSASVCVFVNRITAERVNIGWRNLGGRCIVQKSRSSSNLGVIAPWVRTPPPNVVLGYDVGKTSAGCLVEEVDSRGEHMSSENSLWFVATRRDRWTKKKCDDSSRTSRTRGWTEIRSVRYIYVGWEESDKNSIGDGDKFICNSLISFICYKSLKKFESGSRGGVWECGSFETAHRRVLNMMKTF